MEELLAISFIFGGGTLFLLSISPIGRAIGARIQGRIPGQRKILQKLEDMEQWMVTEVDAMRHQVSELEERLDFTERMLAQQREQQALPGEVERQEKGH